MLTLGGEQDVVTHAPCTLGRLDRQKNSNPTLHASSAAHGTHVHVYRRELGSTYKRLPPRAQASIQMLPPR